MCTFYSSVVPRLFFCTLLWSKTNKTYGPAALAVHLCVPFFFVVQPVMTLSCCLVDELRSHTTWIVVEIIARRNLYPLFSHSDQVRARRLYRPVSIVCHRAAARSRRRIQQEEAALFYLHWLNKRVILLLHWQLHLLPLIMFFNLCFLKPPRQGLEY